MNKYNDYRIERNLPDSNDFIHITGKGLNDALNAFAYALHELGYKTIPKSIIKKSLLDYNKLEDAIEKGAFNNFLDDPKELLNKNLDQAWAMIQDLKSKSEKQKWEMKIGDFNSFAKIYDNKKGVKTMKEKFRCISKDALKKHAKSLNKKDTWKGEDIIEDLADRVIAKYNENGHDSEEAIMGAIDDGLIYTKDIIDLAEHYGVINDSELIERFYEELYNDLANKLEEYEQHNDIDDSKKAKKDVRTKLKGAKSLKGKSKKDSITVVIDEEEALDMLMERVSFWTRDDRALHLFRDYYESLVYGGAFDGGEFNPMNIVDNDYVNNTAIIEKGDDEEAQNWGFDSYADLVERWKNGDADADIVLVEKDGDFLISTY